MAGLRNSVSGITIIAIGTSLPDTFASRSAALHDIGADASIGNITGLCSSFHKHYKMAKMYLQLNLCCISTIQLKLFSQCKCITCDAISYKFVHDPSSQSVQCLSPVSTPPWMGCWSIAGLSPALSSSVSIYTPGWREAL